MALHSTASDLGTSTSASWQAKRRWYKPGWVENYLIHNQFCTNNLSSPSVLHQKLTTYSMRRQWESPNSVMLSRFAMHTNKQQQLPMLWGERLPTQLGFVPQLDHWEVRPLVTCRLGKLAVHLTHMGALAAQCLRLATVLLPQVRMVIKLHHIVLHHLANQRCLQEDFHLPVHLWCNRVLPKAGVRVGRGDGS